MPHSLANERGHCAMVPLTLSSIVNENASQKLH